MRAGAVCLLDKPRDFLRQMLAVAIENLDVLEAAVGEGLEAGLDRRALAAVYLVADDFRAGFAGFCGGGIGGAVIEDHDVIELREGPFGDFEDVVFLAIGGDKRGDIRPVGKCPAHRMTG